MFPSSLKTLMLEDAGNIGILKDSGFPEHLLPSLKFNPDVLKMYTASRRWLSDTGIWMIIFKDFDYQGEGHKSPRGNTIKDGQGIIRWPDGSFYQGEFANGAMTTGQGTFKYSNGDVYEGEMVNGKRRGKGKLTLKDGTVYEGVFDQYNNGKGTITWPDGTVENAQQFFVLEVDGGGARSKTRRKQKRKSRRYNNKIKHKSKYSRRRRRTNRKEK
jgi:hypothetical protein